MKSEQFLNRCLVFLIKPSHWLVFVLWLLMMAPASASVALRVAIEQGVNQVKIGTSSPATVKDAYGRVVGELSAMGGFAAQLHDGKVALHQWTSPQISVEPKGEGYIWIGDRWYRGAVILTPHQGGVTAVNYVDLEKYLYSVLGAEMSSDWPQEALKAQAVAARTYALHERERSEEIYDVTDDQFSQVYQGIVTESPATYAAVDGTANQILVYNGQIILAVFHSASGGHTENVEDIWMNPLPYLRGVPDFDQGTPGYEWSETFSRADLTQRIPGVGNIISLTPERTTPHGSIVTLKVIGETGTKVMRGEEIQRVLGLRSIRFNITPNYSPIARTTGSSALPSSFEIKGLGFGHAVGMSQWGAYNLAKQGYNYQQILSYYYQGASLAIAQVTP